MGFSKYGIYYFQTDQNGRWTKCCGVQNSKGGLGRPILILSSLQWNETVPDEIFMVPLTGQKEIHKGNAFAITLTDDDAVGFNGSIILCDKLSKVMSLQSNDYQYEYAAKIYRQIAQQVLSNVKQFLSATIELP